MAHDDLEAVVHEGFTASVSPSAADRDDVKRLEWKLEELERTARPSRGQPRHPPLIETAKGVINAYHSALA